MGHKVGAIVQVMPSFRTQFTVSMFALKHSLTSHIFMLVWPVCIASPHVSDAFTHRTRACASSASSSQSPVVIATVAGRSLLLLLLRVENETRARARDNTLACRIRVEPNAKR